MRRSRESRPGSDGAFTRQLGVASEHAAVHQAAGDLHVHHAPPLPGTAPGLGSVAVPSDGAEHPIRGRDELLDELVHISRTGGQVVVLHGAGGFGKTALASALARRVQRTARVWWVDATDGESLAGDLRDVALLAGAPRKLVRQAWRGDRSAPDLLWSTLERPGDPWLLVLDNADDPRRIGAGALQGSGRGWIRTPPEHGTVLITSREGRPHGWGIRVTRRHVPALGRHDGAAVLRELAPRAGNHRQAGELSEALGGLPLALCLAGRYLDATSTTVRLPGADQPRTFDEYRAMLRDHFTDAVTAMSPDPARRRECLVTTWESSLDLLRERGHHLARPLLRLLSTFAPAPIPAALLDASALTDSVVFARVTPLQLGTVISELAGLGLVDVHRDDRGGSDTVTLHPLVRDITRHHPDVVVQDGDYAEARLALLHRITTFATEVSNVPLWRALHPHCEHELRVARTATRSSRTFAAMCHNAAGLAYEHGFYAGAERLYRQALRVRLDLLGPVDVHSLATRHNLAVVVADNGDLETARADLRDVLTDQVTVLGEHHPDTLATRRDLARVLWSCGHRATAEAEYREIAAVQRRVLGDAHPDTLITCYEIAAALHDRGDDHTAGRLLQDLLHDQARVLGPLHPHTLITKHRLARLRHDQTADVDGPDLHHVVTLTISALGPEHPITLNARTGRAAAMHAVHADRAQAELREILEIRTSRCGPDHPDTVVSQHNLRVARLACRASTVGAAVGSPPAEADGVFGSPLARRRDRIRVVDPVALPAQRHGEPW